MGSCGRAKDKVLYYRGAVHLDLVLWTKKQTLLLPGAFLRQDRVLMSDLLRRDSESFGRMC